MNTEQEIDDEVCAIMSEHGPDGHVDGHELLADMVMRRVAAERERCARVCDFEASGDGYLSSDAGTAAAAHCARLIRRTEPIV